MAYEIQVAVDCVDPHALADWWAETLGWEVEPTDDAFIRSMIEKGYAQDSETLVHNGNLVWRAGAAICPSDQPAEGSRQRILFQPVPEPKKGKNRVHLDVRLGGDDKGATRSTLETRGATFQHDGQQGPHTWYTMADPEGNEFCIS